MKKQNIITNLGIDYEVFLKELEDADFNGDESITIVTNLDEYTIGKASGYLCGNDNGVISEVLGNVLFRNYYSAGVVTYKYLTEDLKEEIVDVILF